jgi:hypothetical protein
VEAILSGILRWLQKHAAKAGLRDDVFFAWLSGFLAWTITSVLRAVFDT